MTKKNSAKTASNNGKQWKKSAKKKAAKTAHTKADKQVTVRMFCQGLGDCFLITIPQEGKRPYAILVDCGVAKGTTNQSKIMKDVVTQIAELTKPNRNSTKGIIDLLIVSHEHLDHVSGFSQAQDVFESQIAFRNIWFGWTENPRDRLAKELQHQYSKAKLALVKVRARLAADAGASPQYKARLDHLDGVMAFNDLEGALAAAGGQGDLAKGMSNVRKWSRALGDAGLQYLKPGQCLPLPDAEAGMARVVQAYILGPPHDRDKITHINPSTKTPETYEKKKRVAAAAGVTWSWSVAATRELKEELEDDERANFDRSQPFDDQWRIPMNEAPDWFPSSGGESDGEKFFQNRYFTRSDVNDARRIDDDWLWSGAQRLALHIESYTNNTSLVVAFELPRSKKVLLFAGDAQVGNWLSWHDQTYTDADDNACTAEELLNRTVLYKVGHHGSHNATLRQRGLELMNHPDLFAMVPVEAEAVKRLGYGEMPLESLINALHERCDGRVIQLDKLKSSSKFDSNWKEEPILCDEVLEVGKNGEKRPLWVKCAVAD